MLEAISIPKFEVRHINEDSIITKENLFAIADGAGGYGIFADEWSKYLLVNLPEKRLKDYSEFEKWLASIWELFFQNKEKELLTYDGLVQNKFYIEGSCSTLMACWVEGENIHWIQYGDSALFIYDKEERTLASYPEKVMSYQEDPLLISWKVETNPAGFNCGTFNTNKKIVFIASDAMSCYLSLCYKLLKNAEDEDIKEVKNSTCYLNNLYRSCINYLKDKRDFYQDILNPLIVNVKPAELFIKYTKTLLDKGVICPDDYSIIFYESEI